MLKDFIKLHHFDDENKDASTIAKELLQYGFGDCYDKLEVEARGELYSILDMLFEEKVLGEGLKELDLDLDDYSKLLSDEDCEELYNYIMED